MQQENEFLGRPLLGIGAAARSYTELFQYSSHDNSKCSKGSILEFVEKVKQKKFFCDVGYVMDLDEQRRRYVILRLLNFNAGINKEKFFSKFKCRFEDVFPEEYSMLKSYNMINDSSTIILTEYGKKVSNVIPILFSSKTVLAAYS